MSKAKANNIEIEYDTFGDPSSEPILLIMGLGYQMIRWRVEFCNQLADRGFFVIRFDNRDVGLSTKLEEFGVPDIMKASLAIQKGETVETPYTLEDMADDVIGLLDFLNLEKVHVCGASLGGFIAQILAYKYPQRILTLTSIMSGTGNPELPPAKPEVLQMLFSPSPSEREPYIEFKIKQRRMIFGTGFPFDENVQRQIAAESYDRSHYPPGYTRQLLASLVSGDRRSKIATIKLPTLIIHGADDPLVLLEHGRDTAKTIPESELIIIDGLGHTMEAPGSWPQMIDRITQNAKKIQ